MTHGSDCITHSERSSVISSRRTTWLHIITAQEEGREGRRDKEWGKLEMAKKEQKLNSYLRILPLLHPPESLSQMRRVFQDQQNN